jgi:hypothetical protein
MLKNAGAWFVLLMTTFLLQPVLKFALVSQFSFLHTALSKGIFENSIPEVNDIIN